MPSVGAPRASRCHLRERPGHHREPRAQIAWQPGNAAALRTSSCPMTGSVPDQPPGRRPTEATASQTSKTCSLIFCPQTWWHMPIIPAPKRLRQKDHRRFGASLGYMGSAGWEPGKDNYKGLGRLQTCPMCCEGLTD
ncbi:uncharacterized protein LOC134471364 isoform X2 [Cavia porcellus]|uniref:uncharacterized protein LOC134471364 isoform X2 n=1 Tax=Cavia porcellus TaxID=10141 RepID=UPI002FE20E0F